MLTEHDMLVDEAEVMNCEHLTVRIRYRSKPIPCQVRRVDSGQLLVKFLEEANSITPGQSAVFYEGSRVLGGAYIASQRGIGLIIANEQDNF